MPNIRQKHYIIQPVSDQKKIEVLIPANMITTSEISPCPLLAPFIRCYTYCEFNTYGKDLTKQLHANYEMALSIHLNAKPVKFISTGGVLDLSRTYGGIVGLAIHYSGDVIFNGNYFFFEVVFRPNGFNKIFRLPPRESTNQLIFANDIFDTSVNIFYEQLCETNNLNEMGTLADAWLSPYLKKQKFYNQEESITGVSNLIMKSAGRINVKEQAYHTNMSIRNFERHFIEKVGISPKLFCNITRFNHALTLKLKNPKLDWTTIASACGYFDQMHLVKDFKKFAGNTPSTFIKETILNNENDAERKGGEKKIFYFQSVSKYPINRNEISGC